MITGLLALIVAGILQGLFVLPLSFTKNWNWEHNWMMFSFFGMIMLNWLLGLFLFPQAIAVFHKIPATELLLVFSFGLCWGIGAILFGLGMEKLGMSIGYPVIMGLIAGAGTLLPMLLKGAGNIFTLKGAGIIAGSALIIIGILICSKASTARSASVSQTTAKPVLRSAMVIAVLAGLFSALPNIGMSFADQTIHYAVLSGISPKLAGNLVWLLFFTAGFIANEAYTVYLIIRNNSFRQFTGAFNQRNVLLTLVSASCWIASFYLYGFSATALGAFGAVSGWPLFISISIITGNLAGIWKGEWRNATARSLWLLRYGICFFLIALIIIGLSNIF